MGCQMKQAKTYFLLFFTLSLMIGFQNCSKVSFGADASPAPQQAAGGHSQATTDAGVPSTPAGGNGLDPACLVSKGCDPIAKVVKMNCIDQKYIDWPTTPINVYPVQTGDFSFSSGGANLGNFESMQNVISISSDGGTLQARSIKSVQSISASTDINATSIGSISVSAHVCLHNLESVGTMSLSGKTYILGAGKLSIGLLTRISSELLVSDASIDQLDGVSADIYLRGVTLNKLSNCSALINVQKTTIASMDASCVSRVVQIP
jgi:hypothetical protein